MYTRILIDRNNQRFIIVNMFNIKRMYLDNTLLFIS